MTAAAVAVVRADVLDEIVRHARATRPDECCGILFGDDQVIDAAHAARNISDRPSVRFVIDPRDHFDAIRRSRSSGRAIVGFYHSHPAGLAEPSETDRAEAIYPNHLFLIVGLGAEPPEVRLYRFEEGNFSPVEYVTAGE